MSFESAEAMMRLALEEANLAFCEGEVPVGCVIACGGEIIARTHNLREQRQDPTAHAELLAIRLAAEKLHTRRLHDCSLFVTLEPCPMCSGAILMAEMKECFFAASDPAQGCMESVYALTRDPAFYRQVPCYGGLLEKEAQKLLQSFFINRRKNHEI